MSSKMEATIGISWPPSLNSGDPVSKMYITFTSEPGNTASMSFSGPSATNSGIIQKDVPFTDSATYTWDQPNSKILYTFTTTYANSSPFSEASFAIFKAVEATALATTSATTPATIPTATANSTSLLETPSTAPAASSSEPLEGSSQQSPQQTGSSSALPSSLANTETGLQPGPIAGIAIGCFIVGALIATLLVWFLLGRRRKSERARHHESSAVALINREKGATAQVTSVASASPVVQAMENSLPQPLEDSAISGEISKISNAIKNHVQSFYHSGPVSPGLLDLDDLRGLGENLPMSTGTLSTLLGNSDTREIALRFCIAWVAVFRMQPHALPSATFLPPEIAECFLSMTFEDRGPRAHALYFSRWRVITAELMQSAYVRNAFSSIDPRSQNIQGAIDVLESILRPYTDSRIDNTQRRRNLEEILKRSALFAFTLFSQPNSWKFDWQYEEVLKSGSLCVFPALVQITDENGDAVNPPRPFSEAVIRRLDE